MNIVKLATLRYNVRQACQCHNFFPLTKSERCQNSHLVDFGGMSHIVPPKAARIYTVQMLPPAE